MSERDRVEEPKLEHIAVAGDEFMPYGWGGRECCDVCKSIPCGDVCKACSYTETGDFREPILWPCAHERARAQREKYSDYHKKYGTTANG